MNAPTDLMSWSTPQKSVALRVAERLAEAGPDRVDHHEVGDVEQGVGVVDATDGGGGA